MRSIVLSGIVPSAYMEEDRDFYSMLRALRLVFKQCEEEKSCHDHYPDLEADLLKLLTRVNKDPIIVDMDNNILAESRMIINARVVLGGLFNAMYTKEGIEMLPLLIHTAANGNDWIADGLALSLASDFQIQSDMYHFIRCNDNPGVQFSSKTELKNSFDQQLYSYWVNNQTSTELELCETLHLALDSLEQVPVHTNVPALLYTGEFDPVTPPSNTDLVARNFSNASSFVVPGRGHDSPIPMADVMADFFINPSLPPDLSLFRELKPVDFLVGVQLNKGISAVSIKMVRNDFTSTLITIGMLTLMSVSSFLFFSFHLTRAQLKPKAKDNRIVVLLPIWLLNLVCLSFLLLMGLAFKDAQARHLYLPLFGLPATWAFVFYLAWGILPILVLSAFLRIRFHLTINTRVAKLFWSVAWVGGAGLFIWLVYLEII